MEKQVAIIGAGISGLLACKYAIEKGIKPVVFEVQEDIGGVWGRTMESTKLQNEKDSFQFSDFPWPSSVKVLHPTHTQVLDYIKSYAQHFNLFPYIRFNCKVISLDYIGVSEEEMKSLDLSEKTCKPFSSKGKWHLKVQNCTSFCIEQFQFEFVILCIGRYNDFPNIPEFAHDSSPRVFGGKVVHSMDYSAMDRAESVELIKGKRVAVVGAQKSGLDVTAECACINGVAKPCTMILRTVNWMVPNRSTKLKSEFLFLSRFPEFMVHKPGESVWISFLATLLSPLVTSLLSYCRTFLDLQVEEMEKKQS